MTAPKPILSILLCLALFPAFLAGAPADGPYDVILRGGLVVDGTNTPPFRADIGFRDGRVAKIGDLSGERASKDVDARTKVVIPGILDLLCHNELLWSPLEQKRALKRGVTFGLVGNCGFSFLNVAKNLRMVEDQGQLLINVGSLIAQGTVRESVMGKSRKPANAAEMRKMKAMVEQGLQEGAFGLSSGLGYEPGEWTTPGELDNLASVLSKYDHAGYYTHMRNFRSEVLDAIREAVQVSENHRIPVVIQHLLFKMPSNWDQADPGLRLIESARAQGLQVWATTYPYDYWGNEVQIPLQQFLYLLPTAAKWATYLKHPEKRDEVLDETRKRIQEYGDAHRIEITKLDADSPQDWLGLRLDRLAQLRGMTPEECVLALMLETHNEVGICYHGVSQEVLVRQIQAPYMLFGSDAAKDIPHPRNVGSYPRLLSRYVRDQGVIRLSEAVSRLTWEPAKLLGLKDRGLLKEGYWGDAVVIDYDHLEDRATPVNPWESPKGIDLVVVNGKVVLEGDALTGDFPGQVLRRTP